MDMIFCPLFSGSSGNALFVQYGGTRLLIDAGKSGKMIDEALDMIGVDPHTLDALLITHEHSAPICGAGDPVLAPMVRHLPWRIFHGDADPAVEPEYSKKVFTALQALDADVELTMFPGVTHNCWDKSYLETDLIHWLVTGK